MPSLVHLFALSVQHVSQSESSIEKCPQNFSCRILQVQTSEPLTQQNSKHKKIFLKCLKFILRYEKVSFHYEQRENRTGGWRKKRKIIKLSSLESKRLDLHAFAIHTKIKCKIVLTDLNTIESFCEWKKLTEFYYFFSTNRFFGNGNEIKMNGIDSQSWQFRFSLHLTFSTNFLCVSVHSCLYVGDKIYSCNSKYNRTCGFGNK